MDDALDVEMTYPESQDEQEFNDEDAGPPDLNEEVVFKRNKKAINMERLEKLGVIQLVPLAKLEGQESKGTEWKRRTAKMVFFWRTDKANGRSRLLARVHLRYKRT